MPYGSIVDQFLEIADPVEYVRGLGFEPFEWQRYVLESSSRRILLNCARQAGKSTVTGGIGWHAGKTNPGGLVLTFAPTERQSKEFAEKLMAFAQVDIDRGGMQFVVDSSTQKRLSNGARMMILPGTEKSVRGFSGPSVIVIDEASRTEDGLYRAIRPMMTGADTLLLCPSTPFGKRGWWYDEWSGNPMWTKILVKAPVDILPGEDRNPERIVPAAESAEQFAERMWSEHRVVGFYSPRHTLAFMREEFSTMPEYWFRQEYLGEFLEPDTAVFSGDDIAAAFNGEAEPLLDFEDDESSVQPLRWL